MKGFRKKCWAICLTLALVGSMGIPAKAEGVSMKIGGKETNYTGTLIKTKVNGSSVNISQTPGIIIDGYAMIPYRQTLQQSELLVTVSKKGKQITFGYDGNKVLVTINSTTAYVNGNKKKMPMAPKKVTYTGSGKSAVLVPAHYVAGSLGIEYQYDQGSGTVNLNGKTNPKARISGSLMLQYNDKVVQYTGARTKVTLNGKTVPSAMPGIIIGDINTVAANAIFAKSALKATVKVDKINNRLLITYGTKTISMEIGTKKAKVNGADITMPGKALKVKNMDTGKSYHMVPAEFTATQLGLTYKWNNKKATAVMEAEISGANDTQQKPQEGKDDSLEGKTTKLKINGDLQKLPVDPVIKNGANMVPARAAFSDSVIGATLKYDSAAKTLRLTYGKKTIEMTIGSKTAKVNGKKTTILTAPYRQSDKAGKSYVMIPSHFVASTFGFGYEWNAKKLTATITGEFGATKPDGGDEKEDGDKKDDDSSDAPAKPDELRGMWISYLDFDNQKLDEAKFHEEIDAMFARCVELKMNAVFVQVRPFGDALYPSSSFPWSAVISGTQGTDPGYDPLDYMVTKAHSLGLAFHAWVNPYRITASYTGTAASAVNALSDDNPAKVWYKSNNEEDNRNVLNYNKQLYYNPASADVRNLITNGIKEIVRNYPVDGIHFDDYFYPTFSNSNVDTAFDAQEYNEYIEGGGDRTIAQWRRNNVNLLIAKVYKAIKKINDDCVFGVSPAGNISNLRSDLQYYVDVDTWLSQDGYVDYICPQLYWGFENGTYSYDVVYDQWAQLNRGKDVKLYIGIAAYKAGTSSTDEWNSNNDILKRQIQYARTDGSADGFLFFRYGSFQTSAIKKELKNLQSVLK